MSDTYKDTAKAMRKASRKNFPLPKEQKVPDKTKEYKRKPKHPKKEEIK